jgi:hypothetical protein
MPEAVGTHRRPASTEPEQMPGCLARVADEEEQMGAGWALLQGALGQA